MTTKKPGITQLAGARAPAPKALPDEGRAAQTFERRSPSSMRLRPNSPAPLPAKDMGDADTSRDEMTPPAKPVRKAEVEAAPRDVILRLVEALKGL